MEKEPIICTQNYSHATYSQARVMWENGDFSEWVEQNGGWPVFIDGKKVSAEECEEALYDDQWDENAVGFSGWPHGSA